jgi:hypothetical protein
MARENLRADRRSYSQATPQETTSHGGRFHCRPLRPETVQCAPHASHATAPRTWPEEVNLTAFLVARDRWVVVRLTYIRFPDFKH